MNRLHIAVASACLILIGSSCIMRSVEDYQSDTRAVVNTQTDSIKRCLDDARAADANASGDVVVNFNVAKKTGQLENIAVDEAKTTAPPALQACVTDALAGLVLDPGDMGPATVTATWSLQGG